MNNHVHKFEPFAAWIIPGKLLQGAYPLPNPFTSWGDQRDAADARLTKILAAGVEVFVCLQEEVSYAELVDDPTRPRAVSAVQSYAPLLREIMKRPEIGRRDLQFLHFPIKDGYVPADVEAYHELIEQVRALLDDGKTVYVHCMGGIGRAGTFCACLLAATRPMKGMEALGTIQLAFGTRGYPAFVSSPENALQRGFVHEYVQKYVEAPWR